MDLFAPLKGLFEFFSPLFESVPFIRVTLSLVIVFFMPGFAWTMVFFRQLKPLERIPVSIALSIVLVTLGLVFASRIFGTVVNGFNAVMTILVLTILPVAVYYLNRGFKKRRKG